MCELTFVDNFHLPDVVLVAMTKRTRHVRQARSHVLVLLQVYLSRKRHITRCQNLSIARRLFQSVYYTEIFTPRIGVEAVTRSRLFSGRQSRVSSGHPVSPPGWPCECTGHNTKQQPSIVPQQEKHFWNPSFLNRANT